MSDLLLTFGSRVLKVRGTEAESDLGTRKSCLFGTYNRMSGSMHPGPGVFLTFHETKMSCAGLRPTEVFGIHHPNLCGSYNFRS